MEIEGKRYNSTRLIQKVFAWGQDIPFYLFANYQGWV